MEIAPVMIWDMCRTFLTWHALHFIQFKQRSICLETSGKSSMNSVMPAKRNTRPAFTDMLFESTKNKFNSGTCGTNQITNADDEATTKAP